MASLLATEVVIMRSVTRGLCRTVVKAASVSGHSASKCSAGFVRMCGLTANVAVGVMARTAAGVSVRAAARADAKVDAKAAARNKLIRLIVSRLLSQLSVA